MKKIIFSLLSILMITFVLAQNNENRLALVIGNSDYKESPLKSPANDANILADELRELGFDVILGINLNANDLKIKIREFGDKLSKDKGIGLFFFSGFGMNVNGENYMVPIGAMIEKEQDVELEAVNLKRILGEMEYCQNFLNIVIIDAFRNCSHYGYAYSIGQSGMINTLAPAGTILEYSTAPGSLSIESNENNSMYVKELVNALKIPNLRIEEVFYKVRIAVRTQTEGKQVPWETTSVDGEFYFLKE